MLIKGGNASGMLYGDTLSNNKFSGYEFDYIISNPPFGNDWKREKTEVEAEAKKGYDGRFVPGLPAISDGQMLFMLNGIKKLKKGKMQAVKGSSDTEIVPLSDDIDAYMEKNVLPYNPLAFLYHKKDKIGYEIPFTDLVSKPSNHNQRNRTEE